MSGITTTIDRYANGEISFETLAGFLANFEWTVPDDDTPDDPFEAMLTDGGDYPVDGTFDEVILARDLGKLTDEEQMILLEQHNSLA